MDATPLVAIRPLGEVDTPLVRAVAAELGETFAVEVIVLPTRPLPEEALYAPRKRYRGERILAWLEAGRPAHVTKVLGLMARDLSVTKGEVYDWGVIGVAGLSQPAGVVSVHRLGRGRAPASLVERRARRVAVHELGHTFGLPHCRAPGCIMNDAKGGLARVDSSSGEFCGTCRRVLAGLVRGGPAGGG